MTARTSVFSSRASSQYHDEAMPLDSRLTRQVDEAHQRSRRAFLSRSGLFVALTTVATAVPVATGATAVACALGIMFSTLTVFQLRRAVPARRKQLAIVAATPERIKLLPRGATGFVILVEHTQLHLTFRTSQEAAEAFRHLSELAGPGIENIAPAKLVTRFGFRKV